jgi:adenylate cyclase
MRQRAGVWLARAVRLLVGLAAGALGLVLFAWLPPDSAVQTLELQTLDWRFRWRGPVLPGPEAVIIVADDASIAELGGWPLPRDVYARAVRRLAEADPRVVALDVLFTERRAQLPEELQVAIEAMRNAVPALGAARRQLDQALERADQDRRLVRAVSDAGNVVLPYAFVFGDQAANVEGVPEPLLAAAFPVFTQADDGGWAAQPQGVLMPTEALAGAAGTLGHVSLIVDQDGALRFELPVLSLAGGLYPSLPVEAVRLFAGLARDEVVVRLGEGIDLGGRWLPTDRAMRHYINYYGPRGTIPTWSLRDLLRGAIPKEALAGRIVLLGGAAAGTGDTFATPFDQRLPGVEHLATAADNVLHGRSLHRDPTTGGIDTLATLLLGLLGATVAGRRSYLWTTGATILIVGGWWAVATALFVVQQWWLALVIPSLSGLLAAAIVEGIRITAEQRRRRRLERQRANLARYFPPTMVDRLAEDRSGLERTQPAAVMFVDIIGSTGLTERIGPHAAMAMLREFHERVERAVFDHSGMVDKFMGDGAMACFGVPDPDPVAAARAMRAARMLQADLASWARERAGRSQPPVPAGIGIHYGPVLMGDIGGRQQFQFTVVGDTVNVASRLEAMTRRHDAWVIISDDAVQAARAAVPDDPALLAGLEPLAAVPVRGRDEPIRIWRLPRPSG